MRGTCEGMCAEYEREFRDYTSEVHPLEAVSTSSLPLWTG